MTADADSRTRRGAEPAPPRRRHWWRWVGRVVAVLGVAALLTFWWTTLRLAEPASWPPPSAAISAADSVRATAAFAARSHPSVGDLDMRYGWSTAASIEPLPEGRRFFPRMLADIRAARSSIHLMQFGFRPGRVGGAFAAALEDALARGVEVRLVVDGYGSRISGGSRVMYDRLASAGAQIVVNDAVGLPRTGLWRDRSLAWSLAQFGHPEHRKMLIVDGRIAYIGGAGIEDHFMNGGFYDVMVRVTGDVVRQLQSVFLTTFRAHGGPLPATEAGLSRYFPVPADPGEKPVVVVGTKHARDVSALEVCRRLIDGARRRLDLTGPYLTDDDLIDRIAAAARRGVAVRLLVSKHSNSAVHDAALRRHYSELLAAGVQIWEYPHAVMHGKVLLADDTVLVGTVNLDDWSLYRSNEVALLIEDGATAELVERRLFLPCMAVSHPAEAPSGAWTRLIDWLADQLSYFL